jgi:hypothetical protein
MSKTRGSSLLFPIISLFVLVALTTLLIGYWLSLSNLERSLATREEDRVFGIHSVTRAIIDTEISKISAISTHLKKDRDVTAVLSAYAGSKSSASLGRVMDELYEGMGIDYLALTDPRGKNLYSWKHMETRADLAGVWGMDEALEGNVISTIDKGPMGVIVAVISPVYEGKTLIGTILAGMKVDDDFAARLATDTGSKIFFGNAQGLIARSVPADRAYPLDEGLIRHSLLDKRPAIIAEPKTQTVRLYAPVMVLDSHFCLVVETNVSRMYQLLRESRNRLIVSSVVVLLFVVAIGSLLAIRLIRPLRSLRKSAESVIGDYSGGEQLDWGRGNEVHTLVQAFHHMEKTVRDHIAATDSANDQLEKVREQLEERVRERTAELNAAKESAEAANRAKS